MNPRLRSVLAMLLLVSVCAGSLAAVAFWLVEVYRYAVLVP